MATKPLYLTDEEIKSFLNWESLVSVIEDAMGDVSKALVDQPARLMMRIPSKDGILLAMPGFSATQDVLGCKLVTAFSNNKSKGLPSIFGTILFMDPDTGKLKVILEGTEITTWRTAAASIAATKHLHRGNKKILAILGAGTQGRIHAIGMKHYFNFEEVRLWNRTTERAERLCGELGSWCTLYTSKEDCVRGADVIVTATNSSTPIVLMDWVKEGAHINAIGAGFNHHSEIEEKLYIDLSTSLYVDSIATAQTELKGLLNIGVKMTEVGKIINKDTTIPSETKITVFQSMGMAIEDVVAAKLVYESYLKIKHTAV